jgi:hypothetical protein
LVKREQPTADLTATRADGEQVEELLVLLRRPVHGEQVLQGGGIEMFVLHAAKPPLKASWTEKDNSVTLKIRLFVVEKMGRSRGRPTRTNQPLSSSPAPLSPELASAGSEPVKGAKRVKRRDRKWPGIMGLPGLASARAGMAGADGPSRKRVRGPTPLAPLAPFGEREKGEQAA